MQNFSVSARCSLVHVYLAFTLCCGWLHPILCDPMDCTQPGTSVHGDSGVGEFLPKNTGISQPNPGLEPRSPALQANSSPT